MIRQALILLLVSTLLGAGRNLLLPNGIAFVGNWRTISTGTDPIVPPSAEAGDPPFISIDIAQMEHGQGSALFIDAREPSEFECGTIPGSMNIPFDYLPSENLEMYFDSVLSDYSKDKPMVIFCSGDECDLSLHLGRNLMSFGFSNIMIFFGGAREWEKFELQVERRADCAE